MISRLWCGIGDVTGFEVKVTVLEDSVTGVKVTVLEDYVTGVKVTLLEDSVTGMKVTVVDVVLWDTPYDLKSMAWSLFTLLTVHNSPGR